MCICKTYMLAFDGYNMHEGGYLFIILTMMWILKFCKTFNFFCLFEAESFYVGLLSWNSLCKPCWPQTHRDTTASASQVRWVAMASVTLCRSSCKSCQQERPTENEAGKFSTNEGSFDRRPGKENEHSSIT